MACGNCRKRKIRCQPVKDDGRCSQCIRLKKDCQFYAVDQQPPPPTLIRAGSRPLHKTMLAPTATSPPIAPVPIDIQTQTPYNSRAMPAGHDMRPPDMRTDAYIENSKVPPDASPARSYGYGSNIEGWAPSPTAKQGEIAASSWRSYPPESPVVAPGYSPYAVTASQTSVAWAEASPLDATTGPEGVPRPENVWSPYQQQQQHPARSMSFSGDHPGQYIAIAGKPYERKGSVTSDMYQQHPTNIEASPAATYAAWQQPYQPWYAEGGQPVSSAGENPSRLDGMYYGR